MPAHEFHYSHLENLQSDLTYAYRVLRGQGIDGASTVMFTTICWLPIAIAAAAGAWLDQAISGQGRAYRTRRDAVTPDHLADHRG
jgi:hypothetical protein